MGGISTCRKVYFLKKCRAKEFSVKHFAKGLAGVWGSSPKCHFIINCQLECSLFSLLFLHVIFVQNHSLSTAKMAAILPPFFYYGFSRDFSRKAFVFGLFGLPKTSSGVPISSITPSAIKMTLSATLRANSIS